MNVKIVQTPTTSTIRDDDYLILVNDSVKTILVDDFYTPETLSANGGIVRNGNVLTTSLTSVVNTPLSANDIYSFIGLQYDTTLTLDGSDRLSVSGNNILLTATASSIDYFNSLSARTNLAHTSFVSQNIWDNSGNLNKQTLGAYRALTVDINGNSTTVKINENKGDGVFIVGLRLNTAKSLVDGGNLPNSPIDPNFRLLYDAGTSYWHMDKYLVLGDTLKDGTAFGIAGRIKDYQRIELPEGQYEFISGFMMQGTYLFELDFVSGSVELYEYVDGEYVLTRYVSQDVYGSYMSSKYNVSTAYGKFYGNGRFVVKNANYLGGVFPPYLKIKIITQHEHLYNYKFRLDKGPRTFGAYPQNYFSDNYCSYAFKFKYIGPL